MAPNAMIRAAFLGLLVVSTALADVKHLKNLKSISEKIESIKPKIVGESTSASNVNFAISNQPAFSFGARNFGPSTPAPFLFGNSFSTTAAPFKSFAYSSTPAPFAFGNSYSSNIYSNAAAAQSLDASYLGSSPVSFSGSSTPSPLFDGSFASSTAAPLIGSSTAAPILADTALSGSAISGSPLSGAILSDSSFSYSSTPASDLIAGSSPIVSSTPEPVVLNRSPAFATAYGASFTSNVPAFSHGATYIRNDAYNAQFVPGVSVANVPAPHHEITINKEVPVPYYVQVEKRIPYPVLVRVPHPYPVTVEKHVPYAVRVQVDRPVHVPQPYPVEIEKRVPYPVEKPVPYEVKVPVDRPYPVHVPFEKPVPYAVEKPVPYPVRVNVDRPYPVEKPVPYPVPVAKPVPYPVEKAVPYPVEKLVPYPVENKVPYPVRYEVPVNVPVPVEVKVPVSVDRPVPYPVEKKVPYPVQVPVEVKVPVPVQGPVQRFATVHYYQQGPAALGYESVISGQSAYKNYATGYSPAVAAGSVFYGANSSPLNFYGSNSSPVSSYGTTSSPLDFYSSTSSPVSSYGATSSPLNFYTSTPAPASAFSSNGNPVSTYSTTAKPFESLGSDLAQQGFVGINEAQLNSAFGSSQFGFDQQAFFGSSTPAPFNSFSTDTAKASEASVGKSANFESTTDEVVSIGGSSTKSTQSSADENLDVGKK